MKIVAATLVTVVAAQPAWEEFKQTYGKVFNGDEEAHKSTFEANLVKNAAHNALGLSWTLGVNRFSDLTPEEYRVQAGLGYKPSTRWGSMPHLGEHTYNGEELALEVDWTKGRSDPSEGPGPVRVMLGLLHHWQHGGRLGDRQRQARVHVRAAAR